MITLTEAKTYLRVDEWYKDEDQLLRDLIRTATAYVLSRIGRKTVQHIPPADLDIARQATRLLLAHYWRIRTDATETPLKTIPLGVESLCQMIERFNV